MKRQPLKHILLTPFYCVAAFLFIALIIYLLGDFFGPLLIFSLPSLVYFFKYRSARKAPVMASSPEAVSTEQSAPRSITLEQIQNLEAEEKRIQRRAPQGLLFAERASAVLWTLLLTSWISPALVSFFIGPRRSGMGIDVILAQGTGFFISMFIAITFVTFQSSYLRGDFARRKLSCGISFVLFFAGLYLS